MGDELTNVHKLAATGSQEGGGHRREALIAIASAGMPPAMGYSRGTEMGNVNHGPGNAEQVVTDYMNQLAVKNGYLPGAGLPSVTNE